MADVASATGEATQIEQQLRALREALNAAPTAADAEMLVAQVEQKTIALRAKRLQALRGQEELAASQSNVARAQGLVAGELAAVAETTALALAEGAKATVRARWRTATTTPPLSGLKAAAVAAIANPPHTAAKARLEADIPAALITRARHRRAKEAARVGRMRREAVEAENALDDELDSHAGRSGTRLKAQRTFDRAEAALGDYVLSAKERMDHALALLGPIATAPALTPAEQARITDATVTTDGAAAADKEQDRDDAETDLWEAQAVLDRATMTAVAAGQDPTTTPAVQTAKTARDAARSALTTATGAFTAAMRRALDRWEAAVPDTTWQLLADFQEASAALTVLANDEPAGLVTALDAAESALAAALDAESRSADATSFLRESAAARAGALDAAARVEPALLFGALRGDG